MVHSIFRWNLFFLSLASVGPSAAAVLPPPPGTTLIAFDEVPAPCEFAQAFPIADAYASLGVTFLGPGSGEGGAILGDCLAAGVQGHSSPNFLAFQADAVLATGGLALTPEILVFDPPVGYVQVNVGHPSGGVVHLEAYGGPVQSLVDSASVTAEAALATLVVSAPSISLVVLSTDGPGVIVDDLAFGLYDSDADGLGDSQEVEHGTDPHNPDTDGDGLLDGFEVAYQFDPLAPGQEAQDPDGDSLPNLGEQAAGTNPRDADTDDDDLLDGEEISVTGTDPLDADSDNDDLSDGAEVQTHGTDPNNADTDNDGLSDGVEVGNGTDPLDPLDAGETFALVLDRRTRKAILLDPSVPAALGSVALGSGEMVGDCIISTTRLLGYVSDSAHHIWVVTLTDPPQLAPGINPIVVASPGGDLALSPDGRWLLVSGGGGTTISVVDLATRAEHSTYPVLNSAATIEVCPDSSVLVTGGLPYGLHRFRLGADGTLTDSGEYLELVGPYNPFCAPNGQSAFVIEGGMHRLWSFWLSTNLPLASFAAYTGESAFSGAIAGDGRRVYVRRWDTLDAFDYDPVTAQLSPTPVYSRPLGLLTTYGESVAVEHLRDRLYVADYDRVRVYVASDGTTLPDVTHPDLREPSGICFWGGPPGETRGFPPTAVIAGGSADIECSSLSGAAVVLDGTGSTDPDDDITGYVWWRNFGGGSEAVLGHGPTLGVTLPLGLHRISLRVFDQAGRVDMDEVVITVVDTTPPTLSVAVTPAELWPPNHRMVDVLATVSAADLCGTANVRLESVLSNEADDALGGGDGHTVNDVQGVTPGSADVAFSLRAERGSDTGQGRTYTLSYVAMDSALNASRATAVVVVPLHRDGITDPVVLRVSRSGTESLVSWLPVPGASVYRSIRGELGNLRLEQGVIQLGPVTCLGSGTGTFAVDSAVPHPGTGAIYLVEYMDGLFSSFGTETTGRETALTLPEESCP